MRGRVIASVNGYKYPLPLRSASANEIAEIHGHDGQGDGRCGRYGHEQGGAA